MHPDLKFAVELQSLDKEIARLSAEVAYLPRHIQEIENKLAGAQGRLEADRQALAVNQRERRKHESDIAVFQEKIRKYKDQVFAVKTNEEYKALQHEIEYAEREIRKIEDQILERMIAAEEIEARVKKAEKQLAVERVEVEKEKTEATARTQTDERELVSLRERRDKCRRAMSAETLDCYDIVARQRKGTAVAELHDATCAECHVRLRPQAFQEAKGNDRLRQCENCGRILVYVPQEAAQPQQV